MSCVRLLTLLALVGTARASAVDNQACATSSTPSGTDFFPAAARLSPGNLNSGSASAFVDGGEGFNVTYAETFKVVRTKALPGVEALTYVLYQCGTTQPTQDVDGSAFPAGARFFSVPVKRVATGMSVAVGYLEQLGLRDKLKLIDPAYVHAPCVQKAEEDGTLAASHVIYLGWDASTSTAMYNYTLWHNSISTNNVEMVITDEWDTGYSNSDKDVVFTPSHTNLGMLERLSFIKFISLFFNKETQASGYYADQYERWNYMAGQVAAAQARGGIPTGYKCAWVTVTAPYLTYKGTYKIKWDDYKRDICTAAGLSTHIPSAATSSAGSYTYPSKAAFLTDMANAAVVIDESYFKTPSTGATKTAVITNLAFNEAPGLPSLSPSTGMILRTDKHVSDGDPLYSHSTFTPTEALTWYEDSYVHPAMVVQDLVRLSWLNGVTGVTTLQEGCPRFFRDINSNDAVVKTTANECTLWDNARVNGVCLAQLSMQRVAVAALLGASPAARIGANLVTVTFVAIATMILV